MIELLVALNVIDNKQYDNYREKMTPILKTYGGGFSYDFEIKKVLKAKTKAPINRVFTIFFENEERMNSFFSDEKYLQIKEKYFEKSVTDTTIIATYNY